MFVRDCVNIFFLDKNLCLKFLILLIILNKVIKNLFENLSFLIFGKTFILFI